MFVYEQQLIVAGVAGLLSHWLFFVKGEHDLQASRIVRFNVICFMAVFFTKSKFENLTGQHAVLQASVLNVVYVSCLFASIVIYRLYLSPLKKIPGPLRLKLTKLAHVYDMMATQNCKMLDELHNKYGDVVRTGPNEVTLFGTEAFQKVYGPGSTCGKSCYYDTMYPMTSLAYTRDSQLHQHRRKVWDQAFSVRSLGKLEPIIYEELDKLVKQLSQFECQNVDISLWLEYFTWDVMGRFGLTINFDNLTSAKTHPILDLYHMAHERLGPLAAAPWIKHLLMGIPFIKHMKYYKQFFVWTAAELHRNMKALDKDRTDVIGYVIEDTKKNGGIDANFDYLMGEFVLICAAGSDPVRQVLVNLLYYLILQPQHLKIIRSELDSVDIRDYKTMQNLPHMEACILETMRLNPPVPSAGLRLTPAEGLQVGDLVLPPYTTVCVPQYSLFRDERNFTNPTTWIPERFSTRPELILNKAAYAPWSIGKYMCIGKNLSMMEIRMAAALLLSRFDFAFAPGEDGSRMFRDAKDFFTTSPGKIELRLNPRALG